MKIRKIGTAEEKIELQMTPMIDIVFQLLIFFLVACLLATPACLLLAPVFFVIFASLITLRSFTMLSSNA